MNVNELWLQGPEVRAAEDDSTVLSATTFVTAFGLLLLGGPAYAAYDRAAGDQLFKNIAGGAYVLLVCFFFYRLFRKRAASGTSQVSLVLFATTCLYVLPEWGGGSKIQTLLHLLPKGNTTTVGIPYGFMKKILAMSGLQLLY